jgi:hypothetical protein
MPRSNVEHLSGDVISCPHPEGNSTAHHWERPLAADEALEAVKAEGAKYATEGKKPETRAWGEQVVAICVQILKARKARKQIGYARSKVGDDGRCVPRSAWELLRRVGGVPVPRQTGPAGTSSKSPSRSKALSLPAPDWNFGTPIWSRLKRPLGASFVAEFLAPTADFNL